jgi:hypothetical protein
MNAIKWRDWIDNGNEKWGEDIASVERKQIRGLNKRGTIPPLHICPLTFVDGG